MSSIKKVKNGAEIEEFGVDYQLPVKGLFDLGPGAPEVNEPEDSALNLLGLARDSEESIVFRLVDISEFEIVRKEMESRVEEVADGLRIFLHADDWSWVIYRDGKPIGSFYCSTRGPLYQAGMYRHSDGKQLSRTNLEDNPEWHEMEGISSGIAEEFLLGEKCSFCGKRPFQPVEGGRNYCSESCQELGALRAAQRRIDFSKFLAEKTEELKSFPPGANPCYKCGGPVVGGDFICGKCNQGLAR